MYGQCTKDESSEMEVEKESERRKRHAVTDLRHAAEEGGFEMETPRVHARQDDFSSVDIGWSRDVERVHGKTRASQRTVDLTLEWKAEDARLGEDLAGINDDVPMQAVLYGAIHVWYVENHIHDVQMWVDNGECDGALLCRADLHWTDIEAVGWR